MTGLRVCIWMFRWVPLKVRKIAQPMKNHENSHDNLVELRGNMPIFLATLNVFWYSLCQILTSPISKAIVSGIEQEGMSRLGNMNPKYLANMT